MTPEPSANVILSYTSEVVPPRWAQWLMRPLGWPYFSLLTLACLWLLWEARVPYPFLAYALSILLSIPLAILLALRLFLRLILWRIYRQRWRLFLTGMWRFGIPLLAGLAMWGLFYLGVSERLAWWISEPALRRHAQAIIAAEAVNTPPATTPVPYPAKWVGLYKIEDVYYFPDVHALRFGISGAGFLSRVGCAYCPAGPPPRSSSLTPVPFDTSYSHMYGYWYSTGEYSDTHD